MGIQNALTSTATCRPDCSLSRCGDGVREVGESCDDGNRLSLDGCSSLCTIETLIAVGAIPAVSPLGTFTLRAEQGPLYVRMPDGRVIALPASGQIPAGAVLLGQLQPLVTSQPPAGDVGPAAVAVIASGAGAGLAWVRRKRRGRG